MKYETIEKYKILFDSLQEQIFNKNITDKEDQIIYLYKNNIHIKDLMKKYNAGFRYIKKILLKNNVEIRSKGKPRILSAEQKNKVLEMYFQNLSIKKIAEQNNLNQDDVLYLLSKQKLKVKYFKNNFLNENAFTNLNDEAEYWLGMIATDGNIRKKEKSNKKIKNRFLLRLGLKYKDINHIYKLKNFLHSERKIHLRKDKDNPEKIKLATINIDNKKLVNECISYGITPNKTLTLEIKNQELLNSRDFWRGVIDGDGCLIIKKDKKNYCPRISLVSGSYRFIIQYKFFCKRILGKENIKAKIFKDKNTKNPIWRFELNYKNAYNLIDYLYKNNKIALERKEIKAYKILKEFSKQYSKNEE